MTAYRKNKKNVIKRHSDDIEAILARYFAKAAKLSLMPHHVKTYISQLKLLFSLAEFDQRGEPIYDEHGGLKPFCRIPATKESVTDIQKLFSFFEDDLKIQIIDKKLTAAVLPAIKELNKITLDKINNVINATPIKRPTVKK